MKEELCCLVNAQGKCVLCLLKGCKEHSFECGGCLKRFCYKCKPFSECDSCGDIICTTCAKVNENQKVVCSACFLESRNDQDDMYEYDGCPCGCNKS